MLAVMSNMNTETIVENPVVLQPAAFSLRAVALVIDMAILSVVHGILFTLTLSPFAGIVGSWLYYALCESSRWQATPGKKLLGLIVVTEDYDSVSFGRASGRFFCKFLSSALFGVGFIMAAFTDRRQALHDIVARCLVLKVG